uniref:Uncharacterized protein n=1 Tax=Utricularia reniformis TaxID=192314 RepID=A0A1Y0B1Q0_9LAMI|nr:hypothetical protein AEK19_MT1056 [Utricularia reniformis]ART31279.1 hypothetical protein AEK19_MT1056 [Utricularia reniformis]
MFEMERMQSVEKASPEVKRVGFAEWPLDLLRILWVCLSSQTSNAAPPRFKIPLSMPRDVLGLDSTKP